MTHQTESTRGVIFSDPRINLIKAHLESILELIELERDGQPVRVDGFHLKDLRDWTIPLPVPCLESLGSPSTYCNLKCVFCYENGNPPNEMIFSIKRPFLGVDEARARIKNYSSEESKCVAPRVAEVMEPFLNPQYLQILRMVRQKAPEEYFQLITNGSFLTEDTVAELAHLQPLEVLVSLNTANPGLRTRLMGDPHPEVAIRGISLLREYEIPFIGGLVAWPEFPINDVEETIRFFDEHHALAIKVHLGGYSRYFPLKKDLNFKRYWEQVIHLARKLREELRTPIVFSMELYVQDDSTPRVIGTIANSPAEKVGLKPGDVITGVGSHAVSTQFTARFYLERLKGSLMDLEIQRGKDTMKLAIKPPSEFRYPFTKVVYENSSLSGVMIAQGLNLLDLKRLERVIGDCGAARILLLSSRIMRPIVEEQLRGLNNLDDLELYIEVPEHRFWGGNIIVGDLYVVSDFVGCIQDFIKTKAFTPDLVVVPSTAFSLWGHDLRGVHYTEIERLTGARVELLRVDRIM